MQNDQEKQPITLDDLATMIKDGFDDIHEKMATKEDLKSFATKDDLKAFATKDDLVELRSRMIDHVSSQNMHLEHKLVSIMDRQDGKIDSLVNVLQKKNVLTKADANRITNLEPFPQGV